MSRTLYMGTTSIDATKTASEITAELVKAGATSINTDYKAGKVCGLRWVMKVNGKDVLFDMPVRIEPISKLIRDRAQAERVAWRQLLRWVQAQNAMIETGMVQAVEVYLPYRVDPHTGVTLFQFMMDNQFKMLPSPEKPQ